ncbi:MAG: SurA N-terminal domain-containing protein [Candidatus Omnitrophica bacterium]|nr:SurA N-terminal domain-containing protein [Candidatus Omnitrophota bacterium]
MKKIFTFLVILFICNIAFCQHKIVAVVNDDVITDKELKDFLNITKFNLPLESAAINDIQMQQTYEQEKSFALQRLVEDRLIIQEARKSEIEIPEESIDKQIEGFLAQFPSRREFESYLAEKGLTISSLRKKIEEQTLMRYIVRLKIRDKIAITPYEITEYYKGHSDEFKSPLRVDYRALKFTQTFKAYQAHEELEKSGDIGAVLDKYKENRVSGTLSQKESRRELEEIFLLDENKFTSPISLDAELYIFVIDKKYPETQLALDEAKDRIWEILYQNKFQGLMKDWLKDLKETALIKIMPAS